MGLQLRHNNFLETELVGHANTGSIKFIPQVYDNKVLYRYKFFGAQVCNALGLVEDNWYYDKDL